MNLDWLQVCAEGQTDGCVAPIQLAYLVALIVGAILLAVLARRQRDLSTAVLALMPVAIAINIAVGSLTIALRLPIYLDSIGTVLVGALAGPWAGALTGLLSNLIWSILPVPGGAGPTTAFYAPVAAVIGLMAGWWTHRGAFRLRSDDARVGSFLAVAAGIAAAGIAFLIVQSTIGLPELFPEDQATALDNQMRFVLIALAIIAIAVAVGWVTRRTVFAFRGDDARIRPYLAVATGLSAAALVFAILRLLFAPGGYFSAKDGVLDALTSLAIADPGSLILALVLGVVVGVLAWRWASEGDRARLFPAWVAGLTTGFVAAAMSAPISAGVFGGVTGSGTDALVALFRTLGLNVFQSAFAQGLTSDPLDKTLSYTIVYGILVGLPITVRTMFSRGEDTVAAAA